MILLANLLKGSNMKLVLPAEGRNENLGSEVVGSVLSETKF